MKTKLLFLLVCCISYVTTAQTPLWEYTLDSGNLQDTQNNNDFTQNGSNLTVTDNRGNQSNRAISLNGDYLVSASGVSTTNTPRYTISFWLKTSTNDANSRYVLDQLANSGYRIILVNGALRILGRYEYSSSGVTNYSISGNLDFATPMVSDGNWHHIALSVNMSVSNNLTVNYFAKIYLDGTEIENHSHNVTSYYPTVRAINTTAELIAGNNQNLNAPFFYEDAIDDIAFYTTNLSASQVSTLFSTLSVDDVEFNTTISVFPNPTADILQIKSSQPIESVQLFTMEGKQLLNVQNRATIDISQLKSGMYVLTIKTQKGTIIKKISKI